MRPIVLELSGDAVESLCLPPERAEEDLRREFAVFLGKEGLLTRQKARLHSLLQACLSETQSLSAVAIELDGGRVQALKRVASAPTMRVTASMREIGRAHV